MKYRHLKVDILRASGLESALEAFRTLDFCGFNVTLPHKLDAVPILDRVNGSISSIGTVVDTVICDSNNNQSIGFDTDWYGIYCPQVNPLCM